MSVVYEKLGAFYLGKRIEPGAEAATEELVLYDAKDLTTHALCVGMTGSGKTGLCLSLLEEAAIDGVPALVIDPKGDLGNLLLTFPDLRPESFVPWIDPAEAVRKGKSPEELAAGVADLWKNGLASWGQSGERVQRLRDAADFAIYTPGSGAGLPLRVLRSFQAPPPALLSDPDALRERIVTTVSGLLGLLGLEADPIQSREHILVSNLLDRSWREGRSLDLGALIREIQSPPFDRIGVLDLESIYPSRERFELSMRINNLLAAPGFSAWMEGEPLDIASLLRTPEGKPRVSILSIAHLSDAERMFFVTLVLGEVIAWMRAQSGTSSLRAILYMDEIFGYFPPSANPPSKMPMLTLLKQARAFGLGVVLSTQNPVDLDYKGLANCGTWFLGRLQTERDKMRVLDGLEGAAASASRTFDRAALDALLSGLGNRVFLMNNVHDAEPTLFQTRWALSYLRGPLMRQEIERLMSPRKSVSSPGPRAATAPGGTTAPFGAAAPGAASQPSGRAAAVTAPAASRPVLPDGVAERFLAASEPVPPDGLIYRPALIARARLHYVRAREKVDCWIERTWMAPLPESLEGDPWETATPIHPHLDFDAQPVAGAGFAAVPAEAQRDSSYARWSRSLIAAFYRTDRLLVFVCKELDATSKPGESEAEFRARLAHAARESRDLALEKLREKFEKRLGSLQTKIARAEERKAREADQLQQQKMQAAISVGATVLGALFGRKLGSVGNVGRATTAVRSASRISREKGDVGRAEESLETLRAQLSELEAEFRVEAEALSREFESHALTVETIEVPPRKADTTIEELYLAWTPWRRSAEGSLDPVYVCEALETAPTD